MTYDDRAEFSAIIDDTWAAFDRDPRPGVKEKFWGILSKFSIRTAHQAFDGWIESEQRVPTPAAIKKFALNIRRAEKVVSKRTTDLQAKSSPWVALCWDDVDRDRHHESGHHASPSVAALGRTVREVPPATRT